MICWNPRSRRHRERHTNSTGDRETSLSRMLGSPARPTPVAQRSTAKFGTRFPPGGGLFGLSLGTQPDGEMGSPVGRWRVGYLGPGKPLGREVSRGAERDDGKRPVSVWTNRKKLQASHWPRPGGRETRRVLFLACGPFRKSQESHEGEVGGQGGLFANQRWLRQAYEPNYSTL